MRDIGSKASPAEREKYLNKKLNQIVKYAYEKAPAVKNILDTAGVGAVDIRNIKDLEKIPVTPKDELIRLQKETLFGGFLAVPMERLERIFVSPGPLYDAWRLEGITKALANVFRELGYGRGNRVLVTGSYHMVPGAHIADQAFREAGATVIPAGVGNTELQVKVMRDLKVTGYFGAPSFLSTIINKAQETGFDFRNDFQLRWAVLGAEAVPPLLKQTCKQDYGIDVTETYGTADVGIFAYECEQKSGMHIIENMIVEIVDPATGKRVAAGELGEIVVTTFDEFYPLIRLGTGDLSYCSDEPCACGRTSLRLMRIMGRVREGVKIRAMFVYPSQIKEVFTKLPQIARYQLIVDRVQQRDMTTLLIELGGNVTEREHLSYEIQQRFSEVCTVKADNIEFAAPGTIGADATIIVDRRTWK